jgi:hypothetical protein
MCRENQSPYTQQAEWLAQLLRIMEVQISKLGPDTGCPD